MVNPHLNSAMMQVAHIVRCEDGGILGAGRLDPLQMGFTAVERLYPTLDGWVCLAISDDEQFAALGEVLGQDLADDERFDTSEERLVNEDVLIDIISAALSEQPTRWWLQQCRQHGVPAAEPRQDGKSAYLREPRHRGSGRVAEVMHADLGAVRELAQFLRVGARSIPPHRLAPDIGTSTDEVLGWAGYGTEQISHLAQRGAIRLQTPAAS